MLTFGLKWIVFKVHGWRYYRMIAFMNGKSSHCINKTKHLVFLLNFIQIFLKKLLPFYRHMVISWSQDLSGSSEISFEILYQFFWFNKYIDTEWTAIHFIKFSDKNINFILQLFKNDRIISWVNLKDRYELTNDMFFQWALLKHASSARWKKLIFD